jgi:hypothetical protein
MTNSAEFFKYELDGNEYILQNFPLEKVDVCYLYRGIMEYEFISQPVFCGARLCAPALSVRHTCRPAWPCGPVEVYHAGTSQK